MEAGAWEKQPLKFTHAIGYRRPAFPGISVHVQEHAVLLTVYDLKNPFAGVKKPLGFVSFFRICYWNDKDNMQGFATHIVSFPCSSSLSSHSARFH